MNKHRALGIKLEQYRQAKRIHGGMLRLLAAALAVKLARVKIPTRRLRASMYRQIFVKKYPPGLNEEEAELPLWAYPSLNAVFTRGIKPEFRPVPAATTHFLAPCDGTVQEVGRIRQGKIVTLKGIEYTLASLLPGADVQPFEGGHYITIFLSPIHCHRVFSPQAGRLEEAVHVPGFRLQVHPLIGDNGRGTPPPDKVGVVVRQRAAQAADLDGCHRAGFRRRRGRWPVNRDSGGQAVHI